MTSPLKPWEMGFNSGGLQNSTQIRNSATNVVPSGPSIGGRTAPVLPPRPGNTIGNPSCYSSYMPYSGLGYNSYNSYSYGMPYRSYNSYGGYGGYGGYNSYGMYGGGYGAYPGMTGMGIDDAERRFIQYAEESSRNTFASVESIVRAFNSMAMMLDNTFFAMTSSFRAVLSVADNFGRLRSMFGQIWYSVNIFRFLNWVYRKLLQMMGFKVATSASSKAWKEAAANGASGAAAGKAPGGSNWPTLAFLGVILSAPYIISKFLPKYEDKSDMTNWKSPGVRAKAVFDFVAQSPSELSLQTNDIITLAPTYIQEELNLLNSGWAFAVSANGKSGNVPLNYLVISKSKPIMNNNNSYSNNSNLNNTSNVNNAANLNNVEKSSLKNSNLTDQKSPNNSSTKTHTKRVSFGENQIFENVDLDDYIYAKQSQSNDSDKENTENSEKTVNSEEIMTS